jgi:riboflavin kinase/FMN adenylyltransferase
LCSLRLKVHELGARYLDVCDQSLDHERTSQTTAQVSFAIVQVITDLKAIPSGLFSSGSIVTIGAYDGLHVGHREIIEQVTKKAQSAGQKSVLVTFSPHPAQILRPTEAPKLLTDRDQKLRLLESTGIDAVVVIAFDRIQAEETPEGFVQRVLIDALNVKRLIVGEDFCFGKDRRGNVELLSQLGAKFGFVVEPTNLVAGHDDVTASSTHIRSLVLSGDLSAANIYLGRQHELIGTVVHGDARGRTIGFPTANVEVPKTMCQPGDGVYAGWYVRPARDGQPECVYPAAINIGRRPTFYVDAPVSLIEAHVIGETDIDLYGEVATLRFVTRLRGEIKFSGIDELKAQLMRDIENAKAALAAI